MRLSINSITLRASTICRTLLSVAVVVGLATLCRAQDNDNDIDDGFLLYHFSVPAVPPEFGKSSPGAWGALVLTFNGPAGGNGLEGAKFQFMPACPAFLPGTVDDLNSDFPRIQLGPGGYGVGETGTQITSPPFSANNPYLGQNFGFFDVIVEYELGAPGGPPVVTSAFWQSKLKSGGNTTWTFVPDQDLAATIPTPTPVPEPSTLALCICAAGTALFLRRRGKFVLA